jgi:hypothetical protein
MLDRGRCHLICDSDRFPAAQPIVVKEDLSEVRFALESNNPARHVMRLRLSGLPAGRYALRDTSGFAITLDMKDGQEATADLPMQGQGEPRFFTVTRTEDSHKVRPQPAD